MPARLDVHAHDLVPDYRAALVDAGHATVGGMPTPEWSPDLALEFMDRFGIDKQILSVSDPGVSFLPDPATAAELARARNDAIKEIVVAHPDRFAALTVLPLQDVDAAVRETARGLDELSHAGVGLLSSDSGRYLGHPDFEPLLAELDRRGAWAFVHPTAIVGKPSYGVPDFIAEYPFDTTRAFISLLISGAFVRYPRIRWQFAHGGGTLPMLVPRLTGLARHAKLAQSILGLPAGAELLDATSLTQALRASVFDTALIAEPAQLQAVAAVAGADRIAFGSDWPFAALLYVDRDRDPQPAIAETFAAAEQDAILTRTAGTLLKVPSG